MILKILSVRSRHTINIADIGYHYILRPLATLVCFFYKRQFYGLENIPKDKGFIVAANHCTFLDAPFIAYALYPKIIHWIVSKAHVWNKWYFRPACSFSRCVPVNGSVDGALSLLNKGEIIGIFPSGCVSCTKIIRQGRKGAAVLAHKSGAPVVPAYIEASLDTSKEVNIFPKPFKILSVTFGKPIVFEKHGEGKIPDAALEDTLKKIISSINQLADKIE